MYVAVRSLLSVRWLTAFRFSAWDIGTPNVIGRNTTNRMERQDEQFMRNCREEEEGVDRGPNRLGCTPRCSMTIDHRIRFQGPNYLSDIQP